MTNAKPEKQSTTSQSEQKALRPRDRQRIETRNKVFQAAIDEFNRVGVNNAQVEKIIKAAGVSVGTYYRYFPTKDSIIFELMQQYMDRTATDLAEAKLADQHSLKETLLATTSALFDFLEQEDSPLIREIFALMVKQQQPEDFDWTAQPFLASIVDKFQQAKDNNETDYDAIRLTRLFFTAIFGFVTSMNPIRSRNEATEFISVFLRGIQKL